MFDQHTIEAAKANFAAIKTGSAQTDIDELAAKIAENEAAQERIKVRIDDIGALLTKIRDGAIDPSRSVADAVLAGEDANVAVMTHSSRADLEEEGKTLREAYRNLRTDHRLLMEEQRACRPVLEKAKHNAARPLIEAAEVDVRNAVGDLARAYAVLAAIDRVAMCNSKEEEKVGRALNVLRDYADARQPIPVPTEVQDALGGLVGEHRGGAPKAIPFPNFADTANPFMAAMMLGTS